MSNAMEIEIQCPDCGAAIRLTEALAEPFVQRERSQWKERLDREHAANRKRQADLDKDRESLDAERRAVQEEKAGFQKRLEEELGAREMGLRAEAAKKAEEKLAAQLEDAERRMAEQREKIAELRQNELELRHARQTLEDERESLELTVQRRVDDERNAIRAKALEDADERHHLKVAEKDKQLADLRKQLAEAQRKAEQGSQQLQGEVQELELAALLANEFPGDVIEAVAKGQRGGDVLQRVVVADGTCGTILWESKRTKHWSDDWIAKLKDDQRVAGADLAVIVSQALPDGADPFGQRNAIWVTGFPTALPLAHVLRRSLFELAVARRAVEGHQEKQAQLYAYLTGPHFRQRIQALAEALITMQTDLASEKAAIERQWAKREKQLARFLSGTAGLYGDLEGIAGSSLPPIQGLDLRALAPATDAEDDDEDSGTVRQELATTDGDLDIPF